MLEFPVPYREPPQRVARRPDDPAAVTAAISLRDRFGRLEPTTLWPAPADQPFLASSIQIITVSDDGRVALIASRDRVWRLDTAVMTAGPPTVMPGPVLRCALDATGKRAMLICDGALYRWDIGAGEPTQVWRSPGVGHADVVRLSADGRVAVTADYRQRATVRVFDVDAGSMTYSFQTDADEALALHPAGRHIVAFGDDGLARIYGPTGLQRSISSTAGGAISGDGTMLAVNSLDESREIRLFPLEVSLTLMAVGTERRLRLRFSARRWDCKMRFSPSGRQLLVQTDGGRTQLVDLEAETVRRLAVDMERQTALIANEKLVLFPDSSAAAFGVHANGVAVVSCESGAIEHMLCAAAADPMLVAITAVGLHGSIESEPRPISGGTANAPYERPTLMPSLLAEGIVALERDDQLHLEEVRARHASWEPFVAELTADLCLRELMALNRGLVELTDEIMHRARAAIAAEKPPRFGAPQVHRAALEAAAAGLANLAPPARDQVFADMCERLRRTASGEPGLSESETGGSTLPDGADEHDDGSLKGLFDSSRSARPPVPSAPARISPRAPPTALAAVEDQRVSTRRIALAVGATTAAALLLALIYFLASM